MKFTLTVNQLRAVELAIPSIKHAHILDLLMSSSIWAEPVSIDGKIYYWVARQKVCTELPILGLKPDTVYRYLKQLAKLKLISYKKLGKKDCILVTELGKSYYVGKFSEYSNSPMSEKYPDYSKSRKNIRNNSEKFPTDTSYKINNPAAATDVKSPMHKDWTPALTSVVLEQLKAKGLSEGLITEEIENYRIAKLTAPDDKRTLQRWTESFVQTLIRHPLPEGGRLYSVLRRMSDSELISECDKQGISTYGFKRSELEKRLTNRLNQKAT